MNGKKDENEKSREQRKRGAGKGKEVGSGGRRGGGCVGRRWCAALGRHEVLLEEDVGHNRSVKVPKEKDNSQTLSHARKT